MPTVTMDFIKFLRLILYDITTWALIHGIGQHFCYVCLMP